nr:ribosomal protein L32 [Pseudocodon vinciflorus]
MAVPKKRTSISKKRIRKKIWKGKGSRSALKALALGKSLYTGKSKSFVFIYPFIHSSIHPFIQ